MESMLYTSWAPSGVSTPAPLPSGNGAKLCRSANDNVCELGRHVASAKSPGEGVDKEEPSPEKQKGGRSLANFMVSKFGGKV